MAQIKKPKLMLILSFLAIEICFSAGFWDWVLCSHLLSPSLGSLQLRSRKQTHVHLTWDDVSGQAAKEIVALEHSSCVCSKRKWQLGRHGCDPRKALRYFVNTEGKLPKRFLRDSTQLALHFYTCYTQLAGPEDAKLLSKFKAAKAEAHSV